MRIAREPIPAAEESLRCLHLQPPAFCGELHRHGHLELTWIERGQGLRWVGDSVAPFFDGDLVLLGSELPHLWASRGTGSENQPKDGPAIDPEFGAEPEAGIEAIPPCAATVLQFPPDWARRTGLPELKAVAPLMARAAAGLEVTGATREAVQQLMAELPGASALRRVAVLVEILDRLQAGSADLRALSGTPAGATVTGASGGAAANTALPRIDRVLNWIKANLARELRVEEAAAVAHVTPAAFGRFFRREVGKNFTAYVNDARCGWAALRLMQGAEPIAQIAEACGFPTLSNFSEQFRRRYGAGPREFRVGATSKQRR